MFPPWQPYSLDKSVSRRGASDRRLSASGSKLLVIKGRGVQGGLSLGLLLSSIIGPRPGKREEMERKEGGKDRRKEGTQHKQGYKAPAFELILTFGIHL